MEKDLSDYINELDELRGLHVSWVEKFAAVSANTLGHGIYPKDQLQMILPDDRRDLKTVFPNVPEIQGRILIREHALNLSRVENLMDLIGAEKDLTRLYVKRNPDLADKVINEQLKDAVDLALSYNHANDTRREAEVTLRRQQVDGDAELDAAALEKRYQSLRGKFEQIQETAHDPVSANLDEISALENVHEIRLEQAEIYVSRARMLLENAQDLLLQRAQVANAVFSMALPASFSQAKDGGRLQELSQEYGDMAAQDIDNLGLYYEALSKAGTSTGRQFVVTGFAAMDVSFRL